MYKLVVVLLAVSAVSNVYGADSVLRIIGGAAAPKQTLIVSVQYFGQHICGGVILHKDYVLTAASCVFDKNPLAFTIRQNTLLHNKGDIRYVRGITIHLQYDPDYDTNNIAFLKVEDMAFTVGSGPIFAEVPPAIDDDLTIYGWGHTDMVGVVLPDKLQTAVLKADLARTCKEKFGSLIFNDRSMQCTKLDEPKKNACGGDEGGPVFNKDTQLAGIISRSQPCNKSPMIYSSLSKGSPLKKYVEDFINAAGY